MKEEENLQRVKEGVEEEAVAHGEKEKGKSREKGKSIKIGSRWVTQESAATHNSFSGL